MEKSPVQSGVEGDEKSPLGYGVIGNTEVSGTFVLGSSPGTPAVIQKARGSSLSDFLYELVSLF